MHRLTVFQHDIVCNVHDVVDRTHTVGAKSLTQPFGRGRDFHIAHHSGAVSAAEILGRNFNIQKIKKRTLCAALDNRLMMLHGQIESCRGFTGKTDDRVAVRTVVGDFKIDHGVVIADDGVDVITGFAVFLQNPDAVFNGIGKIIQGKPQFFQGAEHAVGNLAAKLALGNMDAAGQTRIMQGGRNQIALVDILRTGNDLNRLFLADIDLTDPHVVGIFVADDGNDLADNHVGNFRIHALIGFYLLTCNGQRFHKFFIGDIAEVNKFLIDPFSVQFHCCPSLELR